MAMAALFILWSDHLYLMIYVVVFHASVEFLNSRKAYQSPQDHRRYNFIFVAFVVFIVLNRARAFRFDEQVEYMLNLIEHGSFALVICLNLLCYMALLGIWSDRTRMLAVVVAFNVIGVANEVFQNEMNDRSLWLFEPDALKDIVVNAIGSLIFLLFVKQRSARSSSLNGPIELKPDHTG